MQSDPTFVPIKTPDHCDRSSGTESDDSSIRSVRFSKLAEVRHMSETDATEALLARLSYQASLRAGEHVRRQANKFSVQKVAKIALMFCLLVCSNLSTSENNTGIDILTFICYIAVVYGKLYLSDLISKN